MSLDKVKLSQLNNINDIPDEALIYVVVGGVSYRTTKAAFLAGIGGGGVTLFTALTDTPASYTGQAGKVLAVKVGEDGLEFVPLPGASVPNLQQVLEQGNQSNIALQFSETSPVIFAEDENGNQMTLSTENLIFLYNDLSQIFLQGGELIFENTAIPNSSATFGFVYPTTSPTTFAYGISQQWVGSVGTRALSLILTDPGVAGRKNLFTPALSQDETIATREWANATFNNHFKGLYANLAALETAHPTASPGDYAIVDAGVGADAVKYIWDNSDEQWVAGTGSSLGSTDDLAEGTTNKYFTDERAQAALVGDLAGKENTSNKATNLTSPDNTKYPTTQAVANGLANKTLPLIADDTTAVVTGVTVPTAFRSYLIPAGTLTNYNRLIMQMQVRKESGTGNGAVQFYVNNSSNFATATLIATVTASSTNLFVALERKMICRGTNLLHVNTVNITSDSIASNQPFVSTAFNRANDIWVFVACNPASTGEVYTLEYFEMNARRTKTSI